MLVSLCAMTAMVSWGYRDSFNYEGTKVTKNQIRQHAHAEPSACHPPTDGFRLTKFFYFLVRRYSDVSCSQVCRKLVAGRELLDGLIHVASEFRLGGGTLFVGGEALFVAT
jgi:hypothetical protein